MLFSDEGVLGTSVHHFATSSSFAAKNLYYLQSAGRYDVTAAYKVSRLNFSSFLLIAVTAGSIGCQSMEQAATAGPGQVLLIDCRKPHAYYAVRPGAFYFIHFDGPRADALTARMAERCGLKLSIGRFGDVVALLDALLSELAKGRGLSEAALSATLYRLLMLLLAEAETGRVNLDDKQTAKRAVDYILAHLRERLTIENLARLCGCSVSYFTRVFKRDTGYSPYQFILNARLDHSRHLLATTALPVQQIADEAGFTTLSNFSAAFGKRYGLTPSDFRKHPV